jgi:hypothetical protein
MGAPKKKVDDKKVDSIDKSADIKSADAISDSSVENPNEALNTMPVQDATTYEIPSINEAQKPVTIQGKTVAPHASGKAYLRNKVTMKLITGLIDYNLALNQIKQYPHIEMINEEQLRNEERNKK